LIPCFVPMRRPSPHATCLPPLIRGAAYHRRRSTAYCCSSAWGAYDQDDYAAINTAKNQRFLSGTDDRELFQVNITAEGNVQHTHWHVWFEHQILRDRCHSLWGG
jgi:hypothetical protein